MCSSSTKGNKSVVVLLGLLGIRIDLMVPKWLADIVMTFPLLYVREEDRYLITFFASHLIGVQMLGCD